MKECIKDVGFGLFEENMPNNIADENIGEDLSHQSEEAESQFITFTINEEEYGTAILKVQEIRGWMKTTTLPNTPDFVVGVTNLRGNIVPIFDLRARFSGERTKVTKRHVVIMVEIDGRAIGLLVDAISDILTIEESHIQPPPTGNLIVDTQYLDGLYALEDRMVALVNINKLFDTEILKQVVQHPA